MITILWRRRHLGTAVDLLKGHIDPMSGRLQMDPYKQLELVSNQFLDGLLNPKEYLVRVIAVLATDMPNNIEEAFVAQLAMAIANEVTK
jgi:hypothetical protein